MFQVLRCPGLSCAPFFRLPDEACAKIRPFLARPQQTWRICVPHDSNEKMRAHRRTATYPNRFNRGFEAACLNEKWCSAASCVRTVQCNISRRVIVGLCVRAIIAHCVGRLQAGSLTASILRMRLGNHPISFASLPLYTAVAEANSAVGGINPSRATPYVFPPYRRRMFRGATQLLKSSFPV